jgi:hypothetical protein
MAGCDKLQTFSGEEGFLKGTIQIGPICPVERIPPDPACLPTADTYKAYPVSIWTTDGLRKIKQINPASDGIYQTDLAPGKYQVVLERNQKLIGGSNLPQLVTILPGDSTVLNINIDTGIR